MKSFVYVCSVTWLFTDMWHTDGAIQLSHLLLSCWHHCTGKISMTFQLTSVHIVTPHLPCMLSTVPTSSSVQCNASTWSYQRVTFPHDATKYIIAHSWGYLFPPYEHLRPRGSYAIQYPSSQCPEQYCQPPHWDVPLKRYSGWVDGLFNTKTTIEKNRFVATDNQFSKTKHFNIHNLNPCCSKSLVP